MPWDDLGGGDGGVVGGGREAQKGGGMCIYMYVCMIHIVV